MAVYQERIYRTSPRRAGSRAQQRLPSCEAHITLPRSELKSGRAAIRLLQELDVSLQVDFFRRVINVDRDERLKALTGTQGTPALACGTPTGHDIEDPGAMITIQEASLGKLIEEVKHALLLISNFNAVLPGLGLQINRFNFEIEVFVSSVQRELCRINMQREFPGYRRVHHAPLFENHIGWHGTKLPTYENIVHRIIELTGFSPHQIVDFSKYPDSRIVDRVVTFYQPNLKAVLALEPKLREAKKAMHAAYVTSEQVCVVGEPIR